MYMYLGEYKQIAIEGGIPRRARWLLREAYHCWILVLGHYTIAGQVIAIQERLPDEVCTINGLLII